MERYDCKHENGQESKDNWENYSDALKKAQESALPDEELKEQNFNRVNTDGFQKMVVLLSRWIEMTMGELFKNRNFRIEITYNAEERKTDFAIYTPKECDLDGNGLERSTG